MGQKKEKANFITPVEENQEICSQLFKRKIKEKVKLATVVKGDQKAPFSIATTLRCRGGHYSFLWIALLYPQYLPYIAEC